MCPLSGHARNPCNNIAKLLYNQVVNKLCRLCGAIFIVCCLLAAGSSTRVEAQRGQSWQYFPDTGHNISGEFWAYYQSIPNAAFVFGSPITEQFTDTQTGRLIQYFQRTRFELHPENPTAQRVVRSALGPYVYQHTPPRGSVNNINPIGCRYYQETGFSLCYAFLEFFDQNGGEIIFGKPISPTVFYNDRIVQYFERGRFDWYPEFPEGQKVALAQLGRIYFDLVPEDANRLQPAKAENAPGDVWAIHARVFTWKALTQINDQQAVYVVVQDQTLNPVAGATTVVTITWAQGGQQSIAQTTNANGVVILPFPVQEQTHGSLILIETEVLYMGLSDKAITSFRVWQ